MSISKIAIAILAAGASSRMGQPKQILKWGDTTLISHCINVCNATSAKETMVVLGANQDAIFPEIKDESVSVIINKHWRLGLGKSIACAAQYCLDSNENSDGLLIVLADQPFVTTHYLNRMIHEFQTTKPDIITTQYASKVKGVPVLFNNTYFKALSQITGDDGAKSIIKSHSNFVKTLTPNFDNVDIDTNGDYNTLLARLHK